ncbi:MAG: hypothetical protein IPF42_16280 [Candidatus Microthrix sp.]|nr:hypothetical protein [Candidatus Microthrix sp.]
MPVGQFIRRAGEDVSPGQRVLPAGTRLTPAAIGVAVSVGRRRVTVVRRPRVGVVSTGDELVTEDRPLRTGELRDSNRPGLLAAVARMGAEAVDLGRVPDDEALIEAALLRGPRTATSSSAPAGCRWGCRPGQGDPRSTRRHALDAGGDQAGHHWPARLDRPRWWACRATRCRRTCPSCCSPPR